MSQNQADLADAGGARNELGTLRTLLPYLWPSTRAELRVCGSCWRSAAWLRPS